MTNPGGDSSETPASDSSSGASEPSSGGYEAPPIEQSQPAVRPQADASSHTEQRCAPARAVHAAGIQPAVVRLRSTVDAISRPPTISSPAIRRPPTRRRRPTRPPPSYPAPGAQQQGYPPPYPDPSAYGGQPSYGAPSYPPPPPPQYGGAPGYPPPSSYPAAGYPGGYSGGYGQPQSETNQFAIWSLVASLIGILCGIGSIVGIVLGVLALNQIKETTSGWPRAGGGRHRGRRRVADHQHHLVRVRVQHLT